MQGHYPEPLPTGLWLREMMALADDCAGKADMAEDHALRRAYYLSCLCPPPLAKLLRPKYLEEDLESFLAKQDIQGAAALVLGPGGDVTIIPLASDTPRFEARYRMGDGDYTALEAGLVGLAMIGAWARFFSG